VSPRRLLVTALIILAATASAPTVAGAAGLQLSVPTAGIDWAAGTVTVSADYPAGTSSVVFSAAGQPLATVSVADATVAGTVSSGVPYRLVASTEFSADARDAANISLGVATFTLAPEMYTPSVPMPVLARGEIVAPSFTLEASSDKTVTEVKITSAPEPMTGKFNLVSGADGQIAVSGVRLPYGIETLRLTASNGFGSSPESKARTVYSLGPPSRLAKRRNYVLVDKHSMTLYDVRDSLVVRHYDIAIGTPSTPTPNGYFKIGAPQPSSGPWGPMRRPLYRFRGARLWATGFYIHGTNAPWAIGTWASHGCVRMYDWAIRKFSKTVPNSTLVLIRR
jgi:lipoprotein-anchoring transpeptidase ErfK/SrfK